MRHRLEDLGRISVMIRSLIDELEELDKPVRAKDASAWFSQKTDEQKEDVIRSWCYSKEENLNNLYDLLAIAEGRDELND
jgi:hypothetical protein